MYEKMIVGKFIHVILDNDDVVFFKNKFVIDKCKVYIVNWAAKKTSGQIFKILLKKKRTKMQLKQCDYDL